VCEAKHGLLLPHLHKFEYPLNTLSRVLRGSPALDLRRVAWSLWRSCTVVVELLKTFSDNISIAARGKYCSSLGRGAFSVSQ